MHIQNKGDLDRIRHCQVIGGDLIVENFKDSLFQLESLEVVDGSLLVRHSSEMLRLEVPRLRKISRLFVLEKITSLVFVLAPSLLEAESIEWNVLPIFSSVNMAMGSIKGLTKLVISDTSLPEVSGVKSPKMSQFDINNNRFMERIDADIEEVTQELHVTANGENAEVDLSGLKSTENLSVHHAAVINVNKLERCTGSMSLQHNLVSNLTLPHLKEIGGTLSLYKNSRLGDASFPEVSEIGGGLVMLENNLLSKVDMFPKLSIIGGALEIAGKIKLVSMPSIRLVRGSAKVKSTDSSFSCNDYAKNGISKAVRGGKNECTNSQNQNFVSTTPTDGGNVENSSDPDFSSSSGSPAVSMQASGNVARGSMLGLFGALCVAGLF